KHPRKHIRVSGIGSPQTVKLVIGDTAIFDDHPFPIKWSERNLIVDGERQDMSIKTHSASGKDPYLSIDCKKLTREARLYLDDKLVLLISPPPEVDVVITGELELDDNPATFDGTFRATDAIELKGKLPKDYDPAKIYQNLNTAGEPALQIGDRIGNFEVVGFTEGFQDYRVTDLEFICEGLDGTEIKVYEDINRNHFVDSYLVDPGDYFLLDVSHLAGDKVYFEIGGKHVAIDLTGKNKAAAGDVFLDCTVFDTVRIPLGPPYYVDLTLELIAAKNPIVLTVHDGKEKDVIGTYRVDSDIDPVFTIDGSRRPKGHLGENLVLEYGWAIPSE
ncbi:MAG: hypothetical protein GY762_09905, partial [Proteobacteria bacterium]|nr:hypothetical protein [Pseudomonadota bacterium]